MENWYYVKQGERQGPVSEYYVQSLLSAGEIDPESLVWNDTMDNWEPASKHFSTSQSAEVPTDQPPRSGNTCSECGMAFSEGELSVFGGKPTCQRCLGDLERKARATTAERSRSTSSGSHTSPTPSGTNNMALTGFILSLTSIFCCGILAIPGLICSISGYKTATANNNNGKGLAVAGIIISLIFLALNAIIIIVMIVGAVLDKGNA